MKTLVIHPTDRSTDFLKLIYENKDYTVVTDHKICGSKRLITELIKKHDRIMMMGHGYPKGLFYTCIDSEMVSLLREKECVCIWCNADKFVEKYGLRGFYTGMFISEVGEAQFYQIRITHEKVMESNLSFARLLNERIDNENLLTEIKSSYIGDCEVIKFNNKRLYYREKNTELK